MKIKKTYEVFILVAIFMTVGVIAVYSTHQPDKDNQQNQQPVIAAEDYQDHVSPWLRSVLVDSSLENIKEVKQNLFDLRSSDENIGQAHIALFLAFDAWENYLTTGQIFMKERAKNHLDSFSQYLPTIAEAKELKKILDG